MIPETFQNHSVFEKLEQLNSRLSDKEAKEKIELDKLSFFESVHKYISDRLKLTIPILAQEAELNALSNEIESGLSQINAYLGNKNEGHLNNAFNNFNTALTRTRNFPLPFAKNDFNFARAVANFQQLVKEKQEILEENNKVLQKEFEDFQNDLVQKDVEIKRLNKQLEQKEIEIQNLNSGFQTEFNNIKSKATQEFETDRKTFRTEVDADKNAFRTEVDQDKKAFREEVESLKETIDTDTSDLIKNLTIRLEEAKKIVNVIGNVGVTGNYQIIANEHKATANIWRFIAISFMTLLSGLIVWSIIDLSSQDFNWIKSLIRVIAAAILSYPATYAAKESSKHRKLETINRTAELELASINPFIEILSEEKKQMIKEKLVEKYFGNGKTNDQEQKEEEVSIAGFEKIMNAVLPLIKK